MPSLIRDLWNSLGDCDTGSQRSEVLRAILQLPADQVLRFFCTEFVLISRQKGLPSAQQRVRFWAVQSRVGNQFANAIAYTVDWEESEFRGAELSLYKTLQVGRIPLGYYFQGRLSGNTAGYRAGKSSFIVIGPMQLFVDNVEAEIPRLDFYTTFRGGRCVHKCAWREQDVDYLTLRTKLHSDAKEDELFALKRISALASGQCSEPANADPNKYGLTSRDEIVRLAVDSRLFTPLVGRIGELLGSNCVDIRIAAASALSSLTQISLPVHDLLAKALYDEDERVCNWALDAIVGPARGIQSLQKVLFAAMEHPIPSVRHKVFALLVHFPKSPLRENVSQLIEQIKQERDPSLLQSRLAALYYELHNHSREERRQVYKQLLCSELPAKARSFAEAALNTIH